MGVDAFPITTPIKDALDTSSSIHSVVNVTTYAGDGSGRAVSICDVPATSGCATSVCGVTMAPDCTISAYDFTTMPGRSMPATSASRTSPSVCSSIDPIAATGGTLVGTVVAPVPLLPASGVVSTDS
jgi:hypothetical protein